MRAYSTSFCIVIADFFLRSYLMHTFENKSLTTGTLLACFAKFKQNVHIKNPLSESTQAVNQNARTVTLRFQDNFNSILGYSNMEYPDMVVVSKLRNSLPSHKSS